MNYRDGGIRYLELFLTVAIAFVGVLTTSHRDGQSWQDLSLLLPAAYSALVSMQAFLRTPRAPSDAEPALVKIDQPAGQPVPVQEMPTAAPAATTTINDPVPAADLRSEPAAPVVSPGTPRNPLL